MIWVFVVLAGVGVFVVAAVAVGRETFRLGHQIPASIFDLEEAVDHVSEGIPSRAQARLTHDEVRVMIAAHIDYLQDNGVLGRHGREPEVVNENLARRENGAVEPQDGEGGASTEPSDVVVADENALAFVLGQVDEAGLEVIDEDAYAVITALHGYLTEIGAVGPPAQGPADTA